MVCYKQTPKGSGWVWLPTDRSATAGASFKHVREGRRGKDCHVRGQKNETWFLKPRTVNWMSTAKAELRRGLA